MLYFIGHYALLLPPHRYINRVMRPGLAFSLPSQPNLFNLESGLGEAFGDEPLHFSGETVVDGHHG